MTVPSFNTPKLKPLAAARSSTPTLRARERERTCRVGSRLQDKEIRGNKKQATPAGFLLASRHAKELPFEHAWRLPQLRHLEHRRMEADDSAHLLSRPRAG